MIAYSKTGDGERQSPDHERTSNAGHDRGSEGPELLEPLRRYLAELQDYLSYYLAARTDAVKLQVRTLLIYAALGVVGGLVGVAALIAAVVLALSGTANGLAELLGGRLWAGQLITGATVLVITAAAIFFAMRSITGGSRKKTVKKYENWRGNQQAQFGHDVLQRSKQAYEHRD